MFSYKIDTRISRKRNYKFMINLLLPKISGVFILCTIFNRFLKYVSLLLAAPIARSYVALPAPNISTWTLPQACTLNDILLRCDTYMLMAEFSGTSSLLKA